MITGLSPKQALLTSLPVWAGPIGSSGGISDEAVRIDAWVREVQREHITPGTSALSASPREHEAPLAEQLFDSLAQAKVLTAQLAMHLSDDWRRRLFSRLDEMLNLEEWDEVDVPLLATSFSTFLRMLIYLCPARLPALGISSCGHLLAAWMNESDRLTIECIPNDRVKWVLRRTIDDDVEQGAGTTVLTRLPEVLAPYHPERWLSA